MGSILPKYVLQACTSIYTNCIS